MISLSFIGSPKGLMEYIGEQICEFCLGEGEVSTDERDTDGNWQCGVGTKKCVCQLKEDWNDRTEDQ